MGCWRLWSAGVLFRDLVTIKPGLGLLLYDVPVFWVCLAGGSSISGSTPVGGTSCKTMTVKRIVPWMPTIPATVRTFKTCDIKNDDSYENGASKASKTRTVRKIVSLTPISSVTVGTFELSDIKNDVYEDRELNTHHPCDCSHF